MLVNMCGITCEVSDKKFFVSTSMCLNYIENLNLGCVPPGLSSRSVWHDPTASVKCNDGDSSFLQNAHNHLQNYVIS
jgi:hypothetical protein